MESILSLHGLLSTIGLGLLIGAVRERAQPDPRHTVAGVRTHLMVALAGALGAALGTAVLVAVLVLIGALTVASYLKSSNTDPGLTGEVALPVTALLAALAHAHPGLAAGLAVVVAGVLYAKQPLHQLVRERVTEQELRDGLLLAGAALVVMPLLPDRAIDPWGVLVPARLWQLVVLILAIGMAGHLASRMVGVRWGLPLAGFLSRIRFLDGSGRGIWPTCPRGAGECGTGRCRCPVRRSGLAGVVCHSGRCRLARPAACGRPGVGQRRRCTGGDRQHGPVAHQHAGQPAPDGQCANLPALAGVAARGADGRGAAGFGRS